MLNIDLSSYSFQLVKKCFTIQVPANWIVDHDYDGHLAEDHAATAGDEVGAVLSRVQRAVVEPLAHRDH